MIDLTNCSVAELRDWVLKYNTSNDIVSEQALVKPALRNPDRGVLPFLLESGLDLNLFDAECLPVPVWFWIIKNKNPLVLADAIAAGANLSLTDYCRRTGLHRAATALSVDHCEILLAAGVNISARSAGGMQAIHEAVRKPNNDAVVRFLLAHGADVNGRSLLGDTPLLTLLGRCPSDDCSATIRILVGAGADINATDNEYCSVLHNALLYGNDLDLFELIVCGIDVHNRDARRPWVMPTWEANCAPTICKFAYLYMAGADVCSNPPITPHPWGQVLFAGLAQLCAERSGPSLRAIPYTSDTLLHAAMKEFVFECNRVIHHHEARIIEVCSALQHLRLPVLQLCEIVRAVLWFWPRLKFHDIWNRVVVVRHFHDRRSRR